MSKKPTIDEMYSVAKKRIGQNPKGGSQRVKPKTKIKARPRVSLKEGVTGFKIKIDKKF